MFLDLPVISSGSKIVFLDPQEKLWTEGAIPQSGRGYTLDDLHGSSITASFDGLAHFDKDTSCHSSTIFRLPLRSVPSDLSKNLFTLPKVLELLDNLRKEAKYLLLFLKSVNRIDVVHVDADGIHTPAFSVAIDSTADVVHERRKLLGQLHDVHLSQACRISDGIQYVASFDITVTENNTKDRSKWLVANRVGSRDSTVLEVVKELQIFPWVGVALEITTNPSTGRVFCFLPLPVKVSSGLPVHVNGTFSLTDDRCNLKWPDLDRGNDKMADWNHILVSKLLPECYFQLLMKAKDQLTTDQFYRAWPDPKELQDTNWKCLFQSLFEKIFQECVLSSTSVEWVKVQETVFVDPQKGNQPENVVSRVLAACGCKVVNAPNVVWNALDSCIGREAVQYVTPSLVRREVRDNQLVYDNEGTTDKLKLLQYCLSDEDYSDLGGLVLIPLANGEFASFSDSSARYVCSKNFPQDLLPQKTDLLVNVSNEVLQKRLLKVATSGHTALKLLNAQTVAALLPGCFPTEWHGRDIVSLPCTSFPSEWFKTFWEWVQHDQLSRFEGLPVLPLATQDIKNGFQVTKLVLTSSSKVIFIPDECQHTCEMLNALHKLQVHCTMTKYMYADYFSVQSYVQKFTDPSQVLTAIANANPNPSDIRCIDFEQAEAEQLQQLLASRKINSLNRSQNRVLRNLKIFHTLNRPTLVSVENMISESWGNQPVLEPQNFFLAPANLPSNLVVFSRSQNQVSLLRHCDVFQPSNVGTLVQTHIFPMIKKGSYHDSKIDAIMKDILNFLSVLKGQTDRGDIATDIQNLPFLRTSSKGRMAPAKLFDPTKKEIMKMFEGESVYPLPPFGEEERYLHLLRECGLRTALRGQELVNVLISIVDSRTTESPQKVSGLIFSKVKAVFDYISSDPDILSESVKYEMWELPLDHILKMIAKQHNCLPVSNSRPAQYPSTLPWKGALFTSHLASLNVSVVVHGDKPLIHTASLVGSQLCIVKVPSVLKVLSTSVSMGTVLNHFKCVMERALEMEITTLSTIVHRIYQYMLRNIRHLQSEPSPLDLYHEKWVWLKKEKKFVQPNLVFLKHHHTFKDNMEPYIYELPEELHEYHLLFTEFGMLESLSNSRIISLLKMIEEDKRDSVDPEKLWTIIEGVLKWLTDNGKKPASEKLSSTDTLYVPVDSTSEGPRLVEISDVVYTDLNILKACHSSRDKGLLFIHKRVSHLARSLGAKGLSEQLNISQNAFGDVGPHEDLESRIKTILKDYKDGLTIVKELLQNADDAEATEVNICYDTRSHCSDNLLFPGMAHCHGPAILFHNDAVFSDEDFDSITKLGETKKQDNHLKIGKFGLGFCSVYHITDIPSFMSKDWLYIFDPTVGYLKQEIENKARPGKKLRILEEVVGYSHQLDPYVDLFGFKRNESYQGTLFRFPFRANHSRLSTLQYDDSHVDQLVNDIKMAGSNLLLFLRNVKRITFNRIDQRDNEMKLVLEIQKESTNTVISCSTCTSLKCAELLSIDVKDQRHSPVSVKHETWLSATYSDVITSKGLRPDIGTSTIACPIDITDSSQLPHRINGQMFCFLPLSLATGLPVHVSSNFAVLNDRTGIHSFDQSGSQRTEGRWNSELMNAIIPRAYHTLLLAMKTMCNERSVLADDYNFTSLWPLKESLRTKNPWERMIQPTYELIADSELFLSSNIGKWLCLKDIKLLSTDILCCAQVPSTPECVVTVIQKLNYPLISMVSNYQKHFPSKDISPCTINEEEFLRIFFSNIDRLSTEVRNDVLFSLLLTYAETIADLDDTKDKSCSLKPHIETCLRYKKCIPCTPDGLELKLCREVIDPDSSFAMLYDPEHKVFPITRFHNNVILRAALRNLGMLCMNMPWDMLIERARNVQTLYGKEREKALKNVPIILQCIDKNLKTQKLHLVTGAEISSSLPIEAKQLTEVAFLPVMDHRPGTYPDEVTWYGNGHTLLCSGAVLCGVSNVELAGSKAAIVCESSIKVRESGSLPSKALCALQVRTEPSCSKVVNHLCHLALKMAELTPHKEQSTKKWIEETCSEISTFLETKLSQGKVTQPDLNKLKTAKCLWTGQEFVKPSSVSITWKLNGPYLFRLPHVLQSKENLIKALAIHNKFDEGQLLETLAQIHDQNPDRRIVDRELRLVIAIAAELNCLIVDKLGDNKVCFLPDQRCHMRSTDSLVCYDAPWVTIGEGVYIVHDDIPMKTAIKLGAQPIQVKAMQQYESSDDGTDFGQHETLTQRIMNILNEYPFNESMIKELLQNADDAQASRMYVILDKRSHGTEKLPSDKWVDLQGPALLVWNDKGFSEKDFRGIQSLGQGGKYLDPETIGQFGIGFNVVYHVTDCPSFLTNGNTLCVLDPHIRYVLGTKKRPGRRYDKLDDRFWEKNFSDLKTPYLREGLIDCPEEIQRGGSLFRFPLRNSKDLLEKSALIDKNPGSRRIGEGAGVLSADKMEKLIKEWAPKMKDSLIFLNNVTELKFFIIDGSNRMQLTFHFNVTLNQGAKAKCAQIRQEGDCPTSGSYELVLSDKQDDERWLVHRGFGDRMIPNQNWEYMPQVKPRHGLAAPIHRTKFEGKVYCFLPLPLASTLPVHVHGNFLLDAARSGPWKSRHSDHADKRTKWNNQLIEAIASSYSKFLVDIQMSHIQQKPYCDRKTLKRDLCKYYEGFPSWTLSKRPEPSDKKVTVSLRPPFSIGAEPATVTKPEYDMGTLARLTFRKIHEENLKVHGVIKKQRDPATEAGVSTSEKSLYDIDWHPLVNVREPSNQVYFVYEKCSADLPSIMERIGMVLTVAPTRIKDHFLDVDFKLPVSDPISVFQYYCKYCGVKESFPRRIQDTAFQSVSDFKKFTFYILKEGKNEDDQGFPKSPFNLPLLLTADEQLRIFDSQRKAVCLLHQYEGLFEKCGYRFVHPKLTGLKYSKSYFLQPLLTSKQLLSSSNNWTDIQEILNVTLPQSLHKVQVVDKSSEQFSHNQLKLLWKCLVNEPLFTEHLSQILQEWTLILSTGDKLYSFPPPHLSSVDQVLPMIPPTDYAHLIQGKPSAEFKVYELLKEHGLPVLDTNVCDMDMSTNFCPHFTEPKKILNTIHHLYVSGQLKTFFKADVLDVHVESLFAYLAGINFKKDHVALSRVKSLPLFKDVNNCYRSINGALYLWPEKVCMSGNEKWLHLYKDTVFLTANGPRHSLASDSQLGMKEMDPLTLYIEFIFPNFKLLSHKDRVAHLECIRDTENFFTAPYSDSKNEELEETAERKKAAVEYISTLMQLPCLTQGNELKPLCEFYDPKARVFQTFPEDLPFLPEELTDDVWLIFFRKLGLRTQPTMKEFIEFCERVSSGELKHLSSASRTLVNCLFSNESWHTDQTFLARVSSIAFVHVQESPRLTWIKSACSTCKSYKRGKETLCFTTLKGSVKSWNHPSNEKLVWTVKPVVIVPGLPYLGLPKDVRVKTDRFMFSVGLTKIPSCEDVVQNILNISQSAFSNFKLFHGYSDKCKLPKRNYYQLVDVLLECFQFLQEKRCEFRLLQKLRRVPCIPVSQTAKVVDITDPILIEPTSVVATHLTNIKDFFPILCPLPDVLFSVLSGVLGEIGVDYDIRVPQIWHALNTIHKHIQFPLDPNYAKIVKLLLRRLYSKLNNIGATTTCTSSGPLYLPDKEGRLVESRYLLYDDRNCYTNPRFVLSHLQYSIFSLLVHPSKELDFYGFLTDEFYHKLPEDLRPLSLSSSCMNKLHERSQPWPVERQSDFAAKLKNVFAMTHFAECVRRMLDQKTTMKEDCTAFASTLNNFLAKLEIRTVSALNATAYLNVISPPSKLGTAKVDFLLQKEEEDYQYSLFLDEDADALKYGLLDNLTESLVRFVGKLSGVDTRYFREPEKAIEHVLRASTPAHLQKILQGLGVKTSDLTFDESSDLNFNPSIGAPIPKRWHHRLQSDINNHFRPQEIAGLEMAEEQYIYVRVERLKAVENPTPSGRNSHQKEEERIRKDDQKDEAIDHESEGRDDPDQTEDEDGQKHRHRDHKDSESDQDDDENEQGDDKAEEIECTVSKLDEYLIWVSDDDKEMRVVSVLDLFKILSIKQVTLNDDSTDLVLYHTEGENVKVWITLKDDNLKEMMKEICFELCRRWNLNDQEQRRKAIKALYLKWHPDKNPHLLASQAFQFLKCQIKRLEQGLPLEDQEDDWVEQTSSPPEAPYWEEYFQMWDDTAADHGHTWKNEKREVKTKTEEEGVTVVHLDPAVHFQVYPQPSIAKVWLEQADYDLRALCVLLKSAGDDIEVSAHVCFLACQVAEKSLKAGMYQMFGLGERNHNFVDYAITLDQETKQQNQGLHDLSRSLVNYYTSTRYPDYYSPQAAPSGKFSKEQAEKAEINARQIFDKICEICRER